jgi:raffinose synthase
MKYTRLITTLSFVLFFAGALPAQKAHKRLIRVLVVDGYSNHDWKQTTSLTKSILEESKLFEVSVSTAPATTNTDTLEKWEPHFDRYDVIIQHSNNLSDTTLKWPRKQEKALEKFVSSGGGLYILHSGNNAFPHWDEYNKMIGLGWRKKDAGVALEIDANKNIVKIPAGEGTNTSHGKRFDALIHILNRTPVNKDYPDQWITPSMELYTYARGPAQNLTVLSYAYDTATNKTWPVEWIMKYGKGNVYNSSMGHLWKGDIYPIQYRCIGFQTTLIRTIEWLADGKVTYPLPANFPGNKISVRDENDYPGSANAKTIVTNTQGEVKIVWNNIERLNGGKGMVQGNNDSISVRTEVRNGVALFSVSGKNAGSVKNEFTGLFFKNIPGLGKGVAFWRYKPWNSWTKPVAVTDATKMESWDVQFFYWQYADKTYGAAVPLSGHGFRTTLGSEGGQWGSKAVSYADNKDNRVVPAMAVAFGSNPYELFERIYRVSLEYMGKGNNLRKNKVLPAQFNYFGWCTWNSSDNGKNLNEEHVIESVKTFTSHQFPLGWVLIDDGWFQHKGGQLASFQPDPQKFPNGFKSMINRLKKECGTRYTGIWHAFDGYWNGIDPGSELGLQYKDQLFSWTQKERPDIDSSPSKTYYFIRPGSDSLRTFYDKWHRYLKKEGFDFLKVDNQSVTERMAVNNYPLFSLSESMHKALYLSANKYFNGAVINCMDMTAESYLNLGSSAVARAVEDYFPYEQKENYNMQRGNAAAHVVQAIYNSIYFSQMAFPDFDMFESYNPNAVFHALARTLNNGPVYITDKPGRQDFDILKKMVFKDGRVIRSETSLLPTEDCLFQLQEPQLFKAFSRVRNTGLLAVFNAADADVAEGSVKPSDIPGIAGTRFVLYDYFNDKGISVNRNERLPVKLPRLGYGLFFVLPLKNGFAPIGLVNKYNAPASIQTEKWNGHTVSINVYEAGLFKAYADKKPTRVLVSGKPAAFSFENNIIEININEMQDKPVITIEWM